MSKCIHTWVGGDLRESYCSKCKVKREDFFRSLVEEAEVFYSKEEKSSEAEKPSNTVKTIKDK